MFGLRLHLQSGRRRPGSRRPRRDRVRAIASGLGLPCLRGGQEPVRESGLKRLVTCPDGHKMKMADANHPA